MTDTDSDLRALAEAHHPVPMEDYLSSVCPTCEEDWPCDVWREASEPDRILALLDRLDKAEAELSVERLAAALPSAMALTKRQEVLSGEGRLRYFWNESELATALLAALTSTDKETQG